MNWRGYILQFFILFSLSLSAQPVINSFTPTSGAAGTSVTITGSGFNATPANNVVFFGAVKAVVTSASANSLTVTAPLNATYRPISVTTAGLTGYSQQPFIVTFASAATFNSTSFAAKKDFTSGNYPRNVSIGDIDGDGKSDLASVNNNGGDVSIFRNTSTPGNVTFASPTFVTSGPTPFGEKIIDADGDGKPDLIINNYEGSITVYRNTSTVGTISFAPAVSLVTNVNPSWFDMADINGDGKPDIVSFNQNTNTFSVLKNTGVPGSILFDSKIDFPAGARPHGGSIADIDGDLKPDLAIANMDVNTVSVFRNTSTSGSISFAPKVDFTTGAIPFNVTIGDLDGDGKKEMVVPNSTSSSISVFTNTSTAGTISFSSKVDFTTAASPLYVSLGDLNGDGKAEVAVANFSSSLVSVYKNQSTPGNLSLAAKMDYATGTLCRSVPLGDIDGDGRPDIVSSNSIDNTISVLRNTTAPAPCATPINVFPHRETFESTDGLWIPGGTASDWTWGTPSKTVINSAGQGNKCWITGGLSNSSYSNSENSFLQSPCFDFSSLIYPRISFKIFWETERRYDGASLQYSTDGGNSWTILGSVNSNADCLGENWYNASNINYLSNSEGWSGNKQPNNGSCLGGSGSSTWLTAAHDLTPLAGQPNVSFRFIFGAGTTCNSYDGFAIDDINIFESPPNTANFSYTCQPDRTVDFTNLSVCATNSSWSFGDPASGANNTSLSTNPTHIFSAPGTYTVTLTSTFATGAPSTTSKQITVLDVTTSIDQPISCNSDKNAILRVTASGSILPYNYSWNTNPVQTTNVINNIGAGSYAVTVSSGTACPVIATIVVTEPSALQVNPVTTPQRCTSLSGAIASNVTGGTAPYSYTWSNGASTPDITNLNAGNYSLQVKDSKGCAVDINTIPVVHQQPSLLVNLGADTTICKGQQLTLNAGNFSSYLWQDNSTSPSFTVSTTGTYFVKVTDNTGCSGTGGIHVIVDCPDIYFPSAFTPNGDSRNNFFGPAGNNFYAIKNYQLKVYNRYGQLVFSSSNPAIKWNGKHKDITLASESFVWMATYSFEGKQQFKKGVVTIIK